MKIEDGLVVELFLVFGLGGEVAEGDHGFVNVPVDPSAGDSEVFGNKCGRLALEFDPLEDLKLTERDAVAEVFDKGGEEGAMKGIGLRWGFGWQCSFGVSSGSEVFRGGERLGVDGSLLAQEVNDPGVDEHAEVGAEAALGVVVAVLAAREEVGDGIGHSVFDEPGAGFLPAGVMAITGAGDHFDGGVVELKKTFP